MCSYRKKKKKACVFNTFDVVAAHASQPNRLFIVAATAATSAASQLLNTIAIRGNGVGGQRPGLEVMESLNDRRPSVIPAATATRTAATAV